MTLIRFFAITIFCCFINQLNAKEYYVNLDDVKLEIELADYYVERVIDVRDVKNCIGFVQKGMNNHRRGAFFENRMEDEFQEMFSRSIPYNAQLNPIIIKINHLYIYELSFLTNELAFAELNISFIVNEGTSYVELFQCALEVKNSGLDVTKSHKNNIKEAIENSFMQFKNRKDSNYFDRRIITEDELYSNTLNTRKYKVQSMNEFPNAIFKNFNDFRDLLPSSTDFNVDFTNDEEVIILRWKHNNKKIRDIWGFTYKNKIYLNVGKDRFHLVNKEAENYVVYEYYPTMTEGGLAISNAIGGPLGVFLYSAIKPSEKIVCDLDFTSGSIMPRVVDNFKEIKGNIIFYFTSYTKAESLIDVSIEDVHHCTLKPGSYYQFNNSIDKKEIQVCLKYKDQDLCQNISSHFFEKRLYLCRIKKGKPLLDKLSPNLESSLLNDFDQGKMEKSNCN